MTTKRTTDWTELYWDLMRAEKFDEAIPLKLNHFPKSFFKYRALTPRTLDVLKEGVIWLAEISSLNDPFECSIQFDNDECLRLFYSSPQFQTNFKNWNGEKLTDTEISRLTSSEKPYEEYVTLFKEKGLVISVSAEEQLKRIQNRWNEIVCEMNRNIKICSFSLVNNSLLLWSHYSHEHKGIAIEYAFEEIDVLRSFMQPVIYRDRVHKIGIFEEYNTMNMIASSLVKSKEWSYEQEWRLTIFRQSEEFPSKMKVPIPIGIYLGTRFKENDDNLKRALFDFAEQNQVSVKQMAKHPNKFELIETVLK